MAKQRNREEVVNTQLALLISTLGVTADAETIHMRGRHRPDVLFQLRGLRVVIEGKFADHPNAEEVVLEDARKRVRSGIAHIAAATVYPLPLRSAPTTKLIDLLKSTQLKYRIVAETHETEWFEGSPALLMDALRRAQEALTKDDIVEETAKSLSMQLEGVAKLWEGKAGACDRLSEILGFSAAKGELSEKARDRRETAAKVSALVLANAFIFQEQLAETDGRITPLRKLAHARDLLGASAEHWKWIWENINYVPIFQLGERILNELPASAHSRLAVDALLKQAISICSQQAALRHDLMGRIYHWLLHHAKYLGTYYTAVPSATLLLKLVLAAKWSQDFGDPVQLASFKVADLACGTGTLLMASAQALSDVYIRTRAEKSLPLEVKDLSTLHRALMENVLHGYDVLPSALHLTASTLAMLAPEVAFVKMNLYVLPLGMDRRDARLGSLDFFGTDAIKTQMALDYSQLESVRTGTSSNVISKATVPRLDLCVMNPPFVRSVGGNLLFGSYPDEERKKMQTELKRRVHLRANPIHASVTAGLGSVFVALADRLLKQNGRLAFVLPAAIVSGEAWAITRKLIADRCHLETVVASHDGERPNFSENTDLSEVLVIARKREQKEQPGRTAYINLWRNPRSIHEALDLANRIVQITPPVTVEGAGLSTIRSASGKLGEIVTFPHPQGEENWTGALFAQTELLRACWTLQRGEVRIPGDSKLYDIPTCRLDKLGKLGYDRRDIHDAFEVSTEDWSPCPAFWSHEADKVRTISQEPTARLLARTVAAKGRKLKDATAVWGKAGRILLVERLWPITHRVLAIGFDTNVLGNTWWALSTVILSADQIKALSLWLNSSLSLLLYFSRRVATRSAWMQMKKPAWEAMPVLDVTALSEHQLMALAAAYDALASEQLEALAKLDYDPNRRRIDDALSAVLGLPSLAPIRELLAREPGLTAKAVAPCPEPAVPSLNDGEIDDEDCANLL
jgi:N-6 DNA Methylase